MNAAAPALSDDRARGPIPAQPIGALEREGLVFFGTSDLAGHFRGKGFPAADLASRLAKGVGMTGSNIMMSAFGPIYETPFGTEGDLVLLPDPTTKVEVPFAGSATEHFYLCDLCTTEGENWSCCPRSFLRRAVAALREEAGLELLASFEQEFVLEGTGDRPGTSYGHDAFRAQGLFGEAFMAALRRAGATPDSFLPEYAPRQFEATVAPKPGLRAADEAVILREMARGVAFRLGLRAIFAPMVEVNAVGSGTHIHFSLWDEAGRPVMHDPARHHGLSEIAEHFVAGIQHHMPALPAVTAPSVASYLRLRPNRWAPTWNNVGYRDRGAALRICPIFATAQEEASRQFNVEYRVADATASPYMALGAILHAGVDGIRRKLALNPPPREGLWDLTEGERKAAGFRPLPQSLDEALAQLAASDAAAAWFGQEFLAVYLQFKRAEMREVAELGEDAVVARYADMY
jgi:glutamine synthetase